MKLTKKQTRLERAQARLVAAQAEVERARLALAEAQEHRPGWAQGAIAAYAFCDPRFLCIRSSAT